MDNVKLKPYIIEAKSSTFETERYVVLASTFAEAESIYLNDLKGYHDIASISMMPNIKAVCSAR